MISTSSSARSWPIFEPAFFMIEVVADGPALPLASDIARWTVSMNMRVSIR